MKRNLAILLSGFILITTAAYALLPNSTLFKYLVHAERSLAGLELKRIHVDGLDIEYLRGGSGPTLVLLHGFGADKDNWNRIAGDLVNYFDVIAIDLPGFGNSTKHMALDYDVRSQIDRLKRIIDAFKLVKFNLAGSSMGGYIAGNFAAQYPSAVEHLWLISPFGVENSKISDMFTATQEDKHPVVLPRTESEFLQLFDFLFVEPPFVPSPIVNHLANKASQNAEINTKIFEQIHRMQNGEPHPDLPLDRALKNYRGPVLISWGSKDRLLHVSGAMGLKQVIPHAKLDINPNVGHLPMMESPSTTANSFLLFTAAL